MPEGGFGDEKAAIASFADPVAPIDLFPNEEKVGVEQSYFFDNFSADGKGAAADVIGEFLLGVSFRIAAPHVIAAAGFGIDAAAGIPNGGGFVIKIDLWTKNARLRIVLSGFDKL